MVVVWRATAAPMSPVDDSTRDEDVNIIEVSMSGPAPILRDM